MWNSLRLQLILSYLVVITAVLIVIGLALALLLLNSPQLRAAAYQQLDDLARALSARESETGRRTAEELYAVLDEVAAARNIRLLIVNRQGIVSYDTAGRLEVGATIEMEFASSEGGLPGSGPPTTDRPPRTWRGSFADQGVVFTVASPSRQVRGYFLLLATQYPNRWLWRAFIKDLLPPLLQAGLMGLAVATALALLISRGVARPLQRLAQAATAVAGGDYEQRAPLAGPLEVRRVAIAFNDMADTVSETRQAQRDFLANVSHELKTPLTSIQGFSQAIMDGAAGEPATIKRAAGVIYAESGRMRRMVEELLDLARIESGQFELVRHPLELGPLLRAVRERFLPQAHEKQIKLGLQLAPELPPITGDGERLAQVFGNLVDNALKHTPAGGQVLLRAEAAQGGVRVGVRDTGSGIPPDELARIFERIYQVAKSRARRDRSGVGLGLAIASEIVAAHGGRIQAQSQPGQGALFTVWLPANETISALGKEK